MRFVVLLVTVSAMIGLGPLAWAEPLENPHEASDASLRAGKQVYTRFCVTCHGTDGKGETDTVADLAVKPNDFTTGEFKHGDTDGHLFALIKKGTETGMEPFEGKIPDTRIWHVVNYLRSFAAEGGGAEAIGDEVPENPIPYETASVARGKQFYNRFCSVCHGRNGIGDTEMREFLSTHPSDLTDSQWKYGDRDGNIFTIIKNGTEYDMEAFADRLTDERIWHVVNYLRSMGPKTK